MLAEPAELLSQHGQPAGPILSCCAQLLARGWVASSSAIALGEPRTLVLTLHPCSHLLLTGLLPVLGRRLQHLGSGCDGQEVRDL